MTEMSNNADIQLEYNLKMKENELLKLIDSMESETISYVAIKDISPRDFATGESTVPETMEIPPNCIVLPELNMSALLGVSNKAKQQKWLNRNHTLKKPHCTTFEPSYNTEYLSVAVSKFTQHSHEGKLDRQPPVKVEKTAKLWKKVEIGQKLKAVKNLDVIIGKFTRLYDFLTEVCKERQWIDCHLLSVPLSGCEDYKLYSKFDNIFEHFCFARNCLFIEHDLIENTFQLAENNQIFDDEMRQNSTALRASLKISIERLYKLENLSICDGKVNKTEYQNVERVLDDVIFTIRYVALIFYVLKEKLSTKRLINRQMFVGS